MTRFDFHHGIFFIQNIETGYKNKVAIMGRETNQDVLYFNYQRE